MFQLLLLQRGGVFAALDYSLSGGGAGAVRDAVWRDTRSAAFVARMRDYLAESPRGLNGTAGEDGAIGEIGLSSPRP